MSLKHGYPKKYNLYDLNISSFKKDSTMWSEQRGFVPSAPLTYLDDFNSEFIVIPLYSQEGDLVSYQLRDIHDEDTETKYKFTKPVYETIVKTDNKDIPGRKVVCEGSVDTVLLREHGINAYCCLGLKKFKILRMLEELEGEKFIFIGDNDHYGKFFSKRYLSNQALIYNAPPIAKDPNDLFIKDKSFFLRWLANLKKLCLA